MFNTILTIGRPLFSIGRLDSTLIESVKGVFSNFHEILYIVSTNYEPMMIYLIEDDPIYSEFIGKSLSKNPEFKITTFFSAEEALTAMENEFPEALIIDYKLPTMSGIDLYDKIKDRVSDDHKVIMMSAIDDGNLVLSFIKQGVRDYVIKDESVISSLEAILEGKEDDSYLFD
jgi:DNA-binding NarL/FixJ family response regulator